jgi:hypothetical protein
LPMSSLLKRPLTVSRRLNAIIVDFILSKKNQFICQ